MENKNLPMLEIGKKMNDTVLAVIGNDKLMGFQKAFQMASAIERLNELLTDEYMKPIMQLQGTALGFKTDKDLVKNPSGKGYLKGEGYPIEIVKRCLIEAVLNGYQPTNNEFNIISATMYPTKNGLERKANEWVGLKYSVVSSIKSFDQTKGSALIDSHIKWSLNGEPSDIIIPIPIKIDMYTSVDAVLGKAKRKALAWLLSNISGEPVVDGDVEDTKFTIIPPKEIKSADEKENQRILDHILQSETLDDLSMVEAFVDTDDKLKEAYDKKLAELKQNKK